VCPSVDPTKLQADGPPLLEYPGDQQTHPRHSELILEKEALPAETLAGVNHVQKGRVRADDQQKWT
jgi:hypothetical protein